ncbi:hypothetical protein UPYG_G00153050 [Umbra pygmaea]|uniref:Uncharacterized protein n=1 Tax=Umbra pygmaea TaxID=75934 RepID=A0ABD0WXN1_UMBPY
MAVLKGKWKEKSICNVCTLLLLCWTVGPSLSASLDTNISHVQCPESSHYISKDGYCCGKCHPGHRLFRDCNKDNEVAKCVPCDINTYRKSSNSAKNCERCTQCADVDVNAEEGTPCTRSSNTVCQCKGGFYKNEIDSLTWECPRCLTCGAGERQIHDCTQERNRECECKEFHYHDKTQRRTCLPCKNCSSDDCRSACLEAHTTPKTGVVQRPYTDPGNAFSLPVMGFAIGFLLMLVVVMVLFMACFWKQRMSSSPSAGPEDLKSNQMLIHGDPENGLNQTCPHRVCDPEDLSKLPDCVPKEIKISEFIYAVLKLVPPRRVKELVRSLDVSDRDIELAENDYLRDTSEAQYHMLNVWAKGGVQGRGGVLPRPLLLEMLVKLRNMDLGGAAQELETKYAEH